MKKSKKTWPEIWLEIAEAFWTPKKKRTKRQRNLACFGLCNALETIGFSYGRSGFIIRSLYPSGPMVWFYDADGDMGFAHKRAQFAEHMAGIPHKDFENFIK